MKSFYIFRKVEADLTKNHKKASLSFALLPKVLGRKQHCLQELFCKSTALTHMPRHPTLQQRNLAALKAVSPSVFNIPPKYIFNLK